MPYVGNVFPVEQMKERRWLLLCVVPGGCFIFVCIDASLVGGSLAYDRRVPT